MTRESPVHFSLPAVLVVFHFVSLLSAIQCTVGATLYYPPPFSFHSTLSGPAAPPSPAA